MHFKSPVANDFLRFHVLHKTLGLRKFIFKHFFIYLDFLKPGKQKNRLFFLLGNLKQYKNHSKADLKPLPDAGHWASGP